MLITNTQVDELLSVLDDLSGLDQELSERCSPLIRSERYDEAVSRAFVVLEERLRELLAVRSGSGGQLVQKLFSSKDTQFTDRLNLPSAEIEGINNLFAGAFRAFRNRAAHTVAGYTLEEARAIVHLVDLLLLVVEQTRRAPAQQIPEKIAQALTPAAKQRLQHFLERLQDIGIRQGRGKGWIPYRAFLEYRAPSWQESRPHSVAIFYLSIKRERPMLAFNSKMLARVIGLDIKQLKTDLLQVRCIRTAAKRTPIRLFLSEYNDQATFDRLYEILRDLMEKHRQRNV
jgi:uncharacterized protein (TIGR02391 family)